MQLKYGLNSHKIISTKFYHTTHNNDFHPRLLLLKFQRKYLSAAPLT